ncbi:uncharacterized mitochondrial protein AtMg00810-like [Benincasa hispida]|uniref:uncharacterized mitochondrial protein AtMg00810-like n=1 Tax=Benincasa hispida TaxID=102211 RepID=UPI0019007BBF|nr:uncharacterized mitochondrial protein AtMg00810-like [Benincasa hispida]
MRPKITYAVNHLSQYLKKPTDIHWQAVKRILRYVSSTRHFGLYIQQGSDLSISAFSDADWAANIDDRKLVAAYCIFLGGNLISWSSKKQSVVTRSSKESEYRALAHASVEIIWVRQLVCEIGVKQKSAPVL